MCLAAVNGEGNGTPLQYSCLENPMDGVAWWAAVHGVDKSWTRLSDFTFSLFFISIKSKKSHLVDFLCYLALFEQMVLSWFRFSYQ